MRGLNGGLDALPGGRAVETSWPTERFGDPTEPALIGRESELSRLLGALGGDDRLVLVVGDAGVGKTRFVAEGGTRAAAAGMVVLRGECLPLLRTLPLHPLADALADLGRWQGGRLLTAALEAAPAYVRDELGRFLPELGPGNGAVPDGADGAWSRERLFTGVAELLAGVANRSASGAALVLEDVHWADSATLDCLTVLFRAGRRSRLRLVVTCRADEAPLAAHVADWLAQARSGAGVEEIRLGPLSRAEVAGQVAALAGGPAAARVVDELFARAEGNPFFTEQLVAAALASRAEGKLRVPAGLPARLAELLTARADRCAGGARAVLAGLAVAGRPLGEDLLAAVTGLDPGAVRQGLRELAAVRLLAEDTAGGGHRPRHALLAEAVADGLLPGERAVLHERTARALAADPALAAEAAGHWQAAGEPAEELPARATAAKAAERVFGYAEAAAHRLRAIELCQACPEVAAPAGIDGPRLYVRAIDALFNSGDSERAGVVSEEAYRRFAGHPDPATAAVVRHRAAYFRLDDPVAACELVEEALGLFDQAPPSFDHANALLDYATIFLLHVKRQPQASLAALRRALEIAEAAGATAMIPRILSVVAFCTFVRGQVEEGFAILERGWALARASHDGPALVWLAVSESYALLKLARYQRAAEVASQGLDAARQAGLESWEYVGILAANAAEALVALGRTEQAAALIDPLTTAPPRRVRLIVNVARAEIDLLRGDTAAATERWRLIRASPATMGRADIASESAQRAAEAALWTGRPGDALHEVRRALALFRTPDLTIFCGRLLTAGLRACADLAEQARARHDEPGLAAAVAAADDLAAWARRMGGAPFTGHPFFVSIPARRATWDAERTRLAGRSDPAAWGGAARAWQEVNRPHWAGYAWWRQAQAHLDAGQPAPAAAALRAAAGAAGGHAPLLAQIRALAERARIPLQCSATVRDAPPPAQAPASHGLTGRELGVLRLVAAGRTNAEIGAELYISPKTAGVHVSNILRKLGVSRRVQAAAWAERAGLLPSGRH